MFVFEIFIKLFRDVVIYYVFSKIKYDHYKLYYIF